MQQLGQDSAWELLVQQAWVRISMLPKGEWTMSNMFTGSYIVQVSISSRVSHSISANSGWGQKNCSSQALVRASWYAQATKPSTQIKIDTLDSHVCLLNKASKILHSL